MIRRQVSAAVLLRDGFTGRVLTGGTVCRLDGQPIRPLWKPEGYLILENLTPGTHRLELLRGGFCPAELTLEIREGTLREETVDLQPGPGYPFPPETAALTVQVQGKKGVPAGELLWMGMPGDAALRLAQDKCLEAGTSVRLFCQGPQIRLPVPGRFLVAGPKGAEIVVLRSLRDGIGQLEAPLTLPHGRGTEWIPVQCQPLDDTGCAVMRFRHLGTVSMFCRGVWTKTPIECGEQEFLWKLEGDH